VITLDLLLNFWTMPFMVRAVIVLVTLGITAGIVGVFVNLRGLEFLTDGLTHAVFPGIAAGVAFAGSGGLLWGAAIAAAAATVFLSLLARRGVSSDAAVAVVLVAGGQGSRLGSDLPKGCFPVGPVTGATLYQIHAEKVLELGRRFGRTPPFLIMTSLGPLIMGAIMIVPVWMASVNVSVKKVLVLDEAGFIEGLLQENDDVKFFYTRTPLKKSLATLEADEYYALVHVPRFQDNDINHLQGQIKLYSAKQVSLNMKLFVRNQIEKQIERLKLQSQGVDQDLVDNVKKTVNVPLEIIPLKGETSSGVEMNTALGMIGGVLIYLFIFLFGAQVMRGVIEEKTNRIVEVIISSVKPFQLMMGKILGIALVGLTQFLLWVVLTGSIYTIFMATVVKDKLSPDKMEALMKQSPDGTAVADFDELRKTQEVVNEVARINWGLMIPCFIFYFLGVNGLS
jgi:hypothetical protein